MTAAPSTYTPPANGFRTFLIVWITQSISVFGSGLTVFALNIWMITDLYPLPSQKPELALAISATSLAFALPTVFLAPLAGAWADRHDRKRTMLVMDFVNGLVSLTLMMAVFTNTLQLWSLVILDFLAASIGAFHGAAFDTSYAMLVPKEQLPRANGMMQTIWADVKEGGLFIWRRRPMVWLLGSFAVANLISGSIGVFTPLLIKFNLAPDWTAHNFTLETALALLGTAASLGGVVGGVAVTAWGGLKKRRVYGGSLPNLPGRSARPWRGSWQAPLTPVTCWPPWDWLRYCFLSTSSSTRSCCG